MSLRKEKIQKLLSKNRIKSLFEFINLKCLLVVRLNDNSYCRDPKDDFIVNLALDNQVSDVITGDKGLLVLKSLDSCRFVTISKFINKL